METDFSIRRCNIARCTGFFLLLFLFFGQTAYAQATQLTGQVIDETQTPLIGVSILNRTGQGGTVTDVDGRFSLSVNQGDELAFTYTGYGEETIQVGNDKDITVQLNSSAALLDEVVVIGYGTTKKSDLTGSVSSVKAEDLSKTTVTTLEQGIQGRLAGVQVTQGDAAPGAGISIQIRGTNSILGGSEPLYVIDGIPVTNPSAGQGDLGASEGNNRIISTTNILATISPSDIESIEVLKDASATAIYGSRGANGVVLITTKKGSAGKGEITFNTSFGLATVKNKLELLDAATFIEYQNKAYENAGQPVSAWPYAPDTVSNPQKPTVSEVLALGNEAYVDWQDEVYQTATINDYQLGFSGGSDKGNYSILASYLDQSGVIKGSQFTRGGLRTNLSYNVNDRVNVTGNLAVTRSRNNLVRSSTNTTQATGGIVRSVLKYPPIRPVFRDTNGVVKLRENEDDFRLEDPAIFQQFGANPLRYTDEVTEEQNFTRLLAGVNVSVEIFEWLSADVRLAANYLDRKNNTYYPRTVSEGFGLNGLAVVSSNEFSNLINENLLRFNKSFGRNRLEGLAGFTYETNKDYWINNEARDFPDDELTFYSLQRGLSHVPTRTNTSTWKLASYLGRVNYIIADKYLFTGTLRYDGSSKFALDKKWAPFYSFAFAWRASQEPFIQNIEAISNLKLRLSYGQSGNQAVGAYQSLATIEGVTTSFNNQLVPAVVEGRLANSSLRWETTSQYNAGLDFELWDGRLFSTVNYYFKETDDLLQNITLAPNTGFNNALVNAGTIQNKGFEFELGLNPIRKSVTWQVSANFSVNRNKITDLGSVEEQFADRLGAGNGLTVLPFIQRPGLPIGSIYGYQETGIFQNEEEVAAFINVQPNAAVGQIRYQDTNGDKTINDEDRIVIGDVNPDFIWGVSNSFDYKGFDFSFLFQGVVGADIINTLSIANHNLDGRTNIPLSVYESAWTGEGSSNTFRQIDLDNTNGRFSNRFIEDGTYLRLKNLQIGYNFRQPAGVSWISNLRLYANAINLITITDYSGYDPEVSAFSGGAMRGVDLGNYPQSRTIMFGLNLTL